MIQQLITIFVTFLRFDNHTVVVITLHTLTYQTLCKWGHFELAKFIFKMLPVSWAQTTLMDIYLGTASFLENTFAIFTIFPE